MGLRFLDCMAGVGRMLFVAAVVRDSADDIFGIVAARESTFRVSPVTFRLASMAGRSMTSVTVPKMAGRFG